MVGVRVIRTLVLVEGIRKKLGFSPTELGSEHFVTGSVHFQDTCVSIALLQQILGDGALCWIILPQNFGFSMHAVANNTQKVHDLSRLARIFDALTRPFFLKIK